MTLATGPSDGPLSKQWCTFMCLDNRIVAFSDTTRLCAESRFFREYQACNSHLPDWNLEIAVPFSSVHLEKFFGLIQKPRFEPLTKSLTETMDLMPFEQLVSLLDFFQVVHPEKWLKELVLDFLSASNLVWHLSTGDVEISESKVFPNFSEMMMNVRKKWCMEPTCSRNPVYTINQIHNFAIKQGYCNTTPSTVFGSSYARGYTGPIG